MRASNATMENWETFKNVRLDLSRKSQGSGVPVAS
jgi:hypothetical protein